MRPNGSVLVPVPVPAGATNHSAASPGTASSRHKQAVRTTCPTHGTVFIESHSLQHPGGAPGLHYDCLGESRKIHLNQSVKRRGAAVLAGLLLAVALGAGRVLVAHLPLAHADAIVSLASHEWERLPAAARLAREQPQAMVILTVPERVTPYNCHDCANRVDRLRHLGVDRARVRELQLNAPGTYGEALAVRAFAEKTHIRSLVVATSPYHTRRALAAFHKVFQGTGIQVGVEPASATSPARPAWWWTAGYDRAYVAYEWAAIAYYTWQYGVGPSEYLNNDPG